MYCYSLAAEGRRESLELEERQRSPLLSDLYRAQWVIIRKSENNSDRKSKAFSKQAKQRTLGMNVSAQILHKVTILSLIFTET
jgi:hypothetical protein